MCLMSERTNELHAQLEKTDNRAVMVSCQQIVSQRQDSIPCCVCWYRSSKLGAKHRLKQLQHSSPKQQMLRWLRVSSSWPVVLADQLGLIPTMASKKRQVGSHW